MNTINLILFLGLIILATLVHDPENERVKVYDDTSKLSLSCDQKLVTITWKGENLWYATRPMRPDEKPEVYLFNEDSGFGTMEGGVEISESKC